VKTVIAGLPRDDPVSVSSVSSLEFTSVTSLAGMKSGAFGTILEANGSAPLFSD